jgi:hypothetical protein
MIYKAAPEQTKTIVGTSGTGIYIVLLTGID